MGCCFSKKTPPLSPSSSSNETGNPKPDPPHIPSTNVTNTPNLKSKNNKQQQQELDVPRQQPIQQDPEQETSSVKKDIPVIKHRKSHEKRSPPPPPPPVSDAVPSTPQPVPAAAAEISDSNSAAIRTSSCTKEEVDAILIQCGRLSRSNSSGPTRKYSGSKRSFDFDNNDRHDTEVAGLADCNDAEDDESGYRRQDRNRDSRRSNRASPSPSKSQGRRRTPSRERDQNQRSGSRERSSNSNGRRVSRSPGRRSENGAPTPAANAASVGNSSNRPGKMVSVPSSLPNDKSNNEGGIKRISVKRNAGEGSRTAASPRSQSPARINQKNSVDNNPPPTLSRSNSRKTEKSPHRRNPLAEIDTNSQPIPQPTPNRSTSVTRVQIRSKDVEGQAVVKESLNFVSNQDQAHKLEVGMNCKVTNIVPSDSKTANENQQEVVGVDGLKPQALTRSRSSRRSRDLDLTPETLLNPQQSSYADLLLEDIQNFHQKSAPPSSFTLPPCVTKACSIVEAVADLNSTTSSNLSCTFSENAKKFSDAKDPFVESEVLVNDDLMEPSLHKYVTVRRGGTGTLLCGEDLDGQESSGSNSFVGGTSSGSQQRGVRSSSWEPSSADSTDRWTSRSNNTKEDQKTDLEEAARRGFSGQRTGIGRGRLVS